MGDSDFPLPPATFEFLTISLKTQAEIQMGLLHFGEEKDRPEPDLRVARHSIDMLGMLQEKTKGNLSLEEQRLIENSLTELRFRYIQTMERTKQGAAAADTGAAREGETATAGGAGESSTETQENSTEGQAR
jgi:hypothetical protein